MYPFGYGKSYSTFEYSDIKVSKTNVSASDTVTVGLEVKNLDESREATEVVQVYVVDEIASVVVPNRLLKGFEKVVIPAGGSKSVSIDIKVEDLGLWNNKMEYVVEKGEFGVLVGSSSVDIRGRVAFWVV